MWINVRITFEDLDQGTISPNSDWQDQDQPRGADQLVTDPGPCYNPASSARQG